MVSPADSEAEGILGSYYITVLLVPWDKLVKGQSKIECGPREDQETTLAGEGLEGICLQWELGRWLAGLQRRRAKSTSAVKL